MYKKLLFILILIISVFCSCGAEAPEIPEQPANDEKIAEEIVPEETPKEPEIEFFTETVDYIPEYKRAHKPGLTEENEPLLEELEGIVFMEYTKCLSQKQKDIIITLWQKEKWNELQNYESKSGCDAMVSFAAKNGGIISAIYNEEKTIVQIKWGEHEEFRKYYEAPKEVFDDLFAFGEKLLESMEYTNKWPETKEELLPEYEKYIKKDRFALNLTENYSEDDYFTENVTELMFRFAYRLAQDAGTVSEDIYYPDYPVEMVEELISTYFLWDIEDIENNVKKYQRQEDFYRFDGEYGSAAIAPVLTKTEREDNILKLYLDLYCYKDENMNTYCIEQSSIVTIRFAEDGTWKYIGNKIYFYRYF